MIVKKFCICILAIVLTSTLYSKPVKVGCYESSDYLHLSEDNKAPTGYAAEYIQSIARYTDWEIEYVNGSWSELFDKMKTGEIDLMPGVSYTKERSKFVNYPELSMSTETYYIYKLDKNSKISSSKLSSLSGKRIGALKDTMLQKTLQDWQKSTNISYDIVLYNTTPELFQAMNSGTIDAMCNTDNNIMANYGYLPLFQIGYSEIYLAASKKSPELIKELNAAIIELNIINPNLISSLQTKYFNETAVKAAISSYSKTKSERLKDVLFENTVIVFEISFTIIIILLVLFFAYFYQQLKAKKAEQEIKEATAEHMEILESLADIYFTTHLFNLKDDTFKVIKSNSDIKEYEILSEANKSLTEIMIKRVSDPYIKHVSEFVDLKTLPARMKGKKSISTEFIGKFNGWCRISFITVKEDENQYPTEVLYTVKIIEEEKQNEETLRKLSLVDSLTGLENRNSYELSLKNYENQIDYSRVIFEMDLDGLKNANDTLGHDAGDELIIGASKVITSIFGDKGRCFRIGGDEFCVIISAEKPELDKMCEAIEQQTKAWKGEKASKLHFSYGYVCTYEFPDYSIQQLLKLADQRMYAMKREYHNMMGIEQKR